MPAAAPDVGCDAGAARTKARTATGRLRAGDRVGGSAGLRMSPQGGGLLASRGHCFTACARPREAMPRATLPRLFTRCLNWLWPRCQMQWLLAVGEPVNVGDEVGEVLLNALVHSLPELRVCAGRRSVHPPRMSQV